MFDSKDSFFLIGSFGASAVILFGAPKSPYSKPSSLFGGHIISSLIGVTVAQILPGDTMIAAAIAVSVSIIVMKLTNTVHPPAGASALIAVIGPTKIKALAYGYTFATVLPGVLILYLVFLIFYKERSTR